ncbi:MAG: aminotransferase class V-fold PLP-dependent enzyme [Clostridia bacterium]|jgi:cysteine desulfurase/selenocysteine lyase|nr:SufS family cysteine desulfurase [Clostridium sp.]
MNPETIRKDFKIFENRNITYLDSGATAQRPYQVINAVEEYYNKNNANPHRGTYDLSIDSTEEYDKARRKVAEFINAKRPEEIVFTKNATEALNLIANSYGLENLQKDDSVVISIMEHHSNIVPWQKVTKLKEAKLEYLYINDNYEITEEEINKKINKNTKIVSITQISNVLGIKTPLDKIIKAAHNVGAIVIVDGSQSVPHIKIDVQEMDADFFVFSGHKLMAPMGIGVLYGKYNLLNKLSPFLMGGDMIEYVYEQETTFAKPPTKFEAGTQNIGGAVGLASAIEYLENIGMKQVEELEEELLHYAKEQFNKLDFIDMYAPKENENQIGVISFNIKDVHPHDTATILSSYGVCVRAGDHCAQPLIRFLNLPATCRASMYIYNTKEDIDKLIYALNKANDMFKKWRR